MRGFVQLTVPLAGPVEDFHLQVIRVSPNKAGQALPAMPGVLFLTENDGPPLIRYHEL